MRKIKKKQDKKFLYTILVVLVLCFIFFVGGQLYQTNKTYTGNSSTVNTNQPSLAPIHDTVKKIDTGSIVVTGKSGDMLLPKDSSIVSVYRNSTSGRQKATFDELKVGANVTVYILIPGKKAEIVIE